MPENNTSQPASEHTPNTFVSPSSALDWNNEWKRLQTMRRRVDDASYWDKRAATFTTKDAPNLYVERFLKLAAIKRGETVFDMGCGTGALTIPLAERGCNVVAADFSRGMLERMQSELDDRDIRNVTVKHMSWEDDWNHFNVKRNSADVAIASRSIATADLRDSILRLTDVAKRRVCATMATGASPRIDERALNAIGLHSPLGRDYLYAFNILAAEGLRPEVSYIDSTRTDTFDSREHALDAFSRMVDDATLGDLSPDGRTRALSRLRIWLEDNLVENERAGKPDGKGEPERALRLREPRMVTWAFIAWNK